MVWRQRPQSLDCPSSLQGQLNTSDSCLLPYFAIFLKLLSILSLEGPKQLMHTRCSQRAVNKKGKYKACKREKKQEEGWQSWFKSAFALTQVVVIL